MANNNSSSSMQSDQYFAEMLNMMREQGRKDNPITLQIGVMQSENSVKINDLELNAEDLYIADYLVKDYAFPLATPYVKEITYGEYGTEVITEEKAVRLEGLKKGDLVVVQRLYNTNKYVILAKVVEVE